MNKIQIRAEKKLGQIRGLLTKASQGETITSDLGYELFLTDAAQLVKYYNHVAKGNFSKARHIQNDINTGTRDLIDSDVFYYINENER